MALIGAGKPGRFPTQVLPPPGTQGLLALTEGTQVLGGGPALDTSLKAS